MQKRNYGLFTATTMITGIVIGSGIFFKSDDVLLYTNGNMLLGILVYCVAAASIIFGCLSFAELAERTDHPGGLVAYAEEFVNPQMACAFGWFQILLYYPTLAAVIAWVCGIYVCQLFQIPASNEMWTLIGFLLLTFTYIWNTISAKIGGIFQNASMIIKLFPLFFIAIAGLIFGEPSPVLSNDWLMIKKGDTGFLWIYAFAPIAFSFDGWIVATSIAHEIKDSKKNSRRALTIGPILILIVYIAYFVGITTLVGPDVIMNQGDSSTYTAANLLIGNLGAKIILIFITVSVLGTLNGLVLGYIRMPYSIALRNMLPKSGWIKKENKQGRPFYSAIFSFAVAAIWMSIHYLTQREGMRGDVSEIAICMSYLNYVILYIAVIRLGRNGLIKSKFRAYIVPGLACCGSFIILSGSITHPLFLYYMGICLLIMGGGYFYYQKHIGQ